MVRKVLYVLVGVPLAFVAWHTLVRVIRHFYKFPIPEFLAGLIDNPWRRRVQPPDEMPRRHGIAPGMRVLEVGPGNGRYTLATARRVGTGGRVVAVDIEPRIVERVRARVAAEGVDNVEVRVADVYDLPFDDGSFDAAYMIAVIGEIPEPDRALAEFRRVLRPAGSLAFSELLVDPDYPLAGTLVRWASAAGFRLRRREGGFFAYTLVFEKRD
ncbi:MAG: class I SAM-dependent methyltransferase [Anaerolineae bacterium]|jgi:ubiquinone/menaquinone biosynthesis C-methylase UbiE